MPISRSTEIMPPTELKHWLWLTLIGTYSCRDAIGASVKVTTRSGRVLYNHVAISVGLMSSTDKRVHFGLGSENEVALIEIQWPRGRTGRVRTRVSAETGNRQVVATAALRGASNRQAPAIVIVVPAAETPATVARELAI